MAKNVMWQAKDKILKIYKGISPSRLLRIEKSNRAPPNYWSQKHNQRDFMKKCEEKLKISEWSDWYKVTNKDIVRLGGAVLINQYYKGSPSKLIMATYPDHPWNPLEFSRVPVNYWSLKSNREEFMRSLEVNLNISDWKDWYKVTRKDIIRSGGLTLVDYYQGSPSLLIMSMFPDHPWRISDFSHVPRNYWNVESNQRAFVKVLESDLGIEDWKDWYKITIKDIVRLGGDGLLNLHNRSPSTLITSMYPNHPWNLLEFQRVPHHYWASKANQTDFMKSLEEKLNVSDWKDWYHVTANDLQRLGGNTLLSVYYGGSPSTLIMTTFPQHPWRIFDFRSRFAWDPAKMRLFLSHVASHLQIESRTAWRTLSSVQLKDFRGGNSLIRQTGSLYDALKIAYPTNDWEFLANVKISKPQNAIVDVLRKYIPRKLFLVNHRHDDLIHKSGVKAELDIWIPSINLAIEYHGEHHFHQLWERSQHPEVRKIRDSEKRALCAKRGIRLVEVPYWWDKTEEQLVAIIRGVHPEFLENINRFEQILPIRQHKILREHKIAISWSSGLEFSPLKMIVSNWYASEKLDGIRVHWDGINVLSRGNHDIKLMEPSPVPLSNQAVDGELWYGRGVRLGFGAIQTPNLLAFDSIASNVLPTFENRRTKCPLK